MGAPLRQQATCPVGKATGTHLVGRIGKLLLRASIDAINPDVGRSDSLPRLAVSCAIAACQSVALRRFRCSGVTGKAVNPRADFYVVDDAAPRHDGCKEPPTCLSVVSCSSMTSLHCGVSSVVHS